MGKGDRKTRKGKIANKSYGVRRPGHIKRKPTLEEKIRVDKKI
ncbi:30S ribosomal protein S31 [Saonia flava]|uniref:30S ribosomal protein S31 n=1 Tax=Saonia flava TaxID=523696 RepID=A0A846QUR1_9FLAO|nr:30S ribosomal protein THX [Saonia flava]NJB70690.1 30S ribosomal protein S31 [Saonia flava]